MIEWLRIWVIKPIIEILLLVPLPWRYGIGVFVLLFLVYLISPLGIIHRGVMWIVFVVLQVFKRLAEAVQQLCANRAPSAFIDAVDNGSEWVLQSLSRTEQGVRHRLRFPLTWGRLKLGMVLLLPLVPLAAWYVRPQLGDITVARGIDGGLLSWHALEGWALTGQWEPWTTPEYETHSIVSPMLQPEPSVSDTDPVHVVQPGDVLNGIARHYQVTMRCIIAVNQDRYPDFNPDVLSIGMELKIPASDPQCRRSE